MSLAVLFGTTSMLSVTITFERKSRSFERLLLAPISLNLLMLAKTSGAIVFGILNAMVPAIIASFIVDLSGINWFTTIASIVFIAVTSTFLGLFISVSVNEVFERVPALLRPISYVLPLTYGADILKTAINQNGMIASWISFSVLIVYSLFLFLMSTHNIQKKWIY